MTDLDTDHLASRIRDRVARHLPEHVAELSRLVAIPGTADRPDALAETAALLVDVMGRCGLRATEIETGGPPVVFGERHVGNDRPTVLVYGHYDVQPVEPLDAWHSSPFAPEVRDGRLFGRGTGDNKGQHLAQLLAVEALMAEAGELPVNVKVLIEGEEEVGSPHLADFVRAHRELLAADLAYTSDGPLHPSGSPMVILGCRGYLYADLTLHGARVDLHSGSWGGVAPNPAQRLAAVVAALFDGDRVTLPGFYDDVREPAPADREACAALPSPAAHLARLGITAPGEAAALGARLSLEPNLNLAGFGGGYVGSGIQTVIPAHAVAKIDMRLVPDQDPLVLFGRLAAFVTEREPDAEVVLRGATPPSRTAGDDPLVERVRRGVAVGFGQNPLLLPALPSTLPDYVFTKLLGIPSVIVPYANVDQANHAPNENLALDNFAAGIRCFAAVLRSLADVGSV